MTLSEMKNGQSAKIVAINGADIDSSLMIKLTAMGFVKGSAVEVVRRAPLGRGIQLKLRGGDLCLTPTLASRVVVA